MPPRKSTTSAAPAEAEEDSSPKPKSVPKDSRDDTLSVEDLNLPKSIVQRLAKGVLPPNTQIQKDALLAMSKSATVFVNYITAVAAEHALRSGRRTVNPENVFAAMDQVEFAFMLPRLEAEVAKFTSIQADKRNTYRKKVREEKKAAKEEPGSTGPSTVGGDDEPAAKRARLDGEVEEEDDEADADETVDVEDEEVEDDEIEEDEGETQEGLTEDLLEEREEKDEDDEMADADESD